MQAPKKTGFKWVPVVMTVAVVATAWLVRGGESEGEAMDEDYRNQRLQMVEKQIARRGVSDLRVLEAMRSVPRHEFVPETFRNEAYDDHPLPIGQGQTISQPYIVALMTEALALRGGERVLELGTGSGYQAAVLAAIVDSVFTIEYFPRLAEEADRTLARLGYANVEVRTGDGWWGWAEKAPFDAAIVTFAAPEIPPAVFEQLRIGGRICVPIGPAAGTQELIVVTKGEKGTTDRRSLGAVRFVPVRGDGAR
jgi:protein-L-isoaspartate(D-aspartate) O-methyltransferase